MWTMRFRRLLPLSLLCLLATACGNVALDDLNAAGRGAPAPAAPAAAPEAASAPEASALPNETSGAEAPLAATTPGVPAPASGGVGRTTASPSQPTVSPRAAAGSAVPGKTSAANPAVAQSSNGAASAMPGGPSPAPGEPAAGGGGTIVIGSVDHRSAPIAICKGSYEGVSAYFADVNAAGGINGYRFKFISYDDGMDPNRNAAFVKQLVEQDKVTAIVGHCSELANTPAAPITTQAGVPVIGGAGTASVWYQTPNWFANSASQQQLYPKFMLQYSKQKFNCTKVAVLYINVPQGQGGARYARQYAPQFGQEVVFDSSFSLTEPDFTSFVVKMKQAGAECINFPGTSDHIIRLLKAMQQQGYDAKLVAPLPGYDPIIGPAVGSFVEGHLFVVVNHAPLELSDPAAVTRYKEAMRRYQPKMVPNTWSIDGWMSGEIFTEAVRRLGPKPVTRESVIESLRTFKNWTGSFNPPLTYVNGPNTFPAGCNSILRAKADGSFGPESPRFVCTDGY